MTALKRHQTQDRAYVVMAVWTRMKNVMLATQATNAVMKSVSSGSKFEVKFNAAP